MMDLLSSFNPWTMLAALLPVGVEAGKALVQRFIAPDQVKPTSFEQFLEWQRLQFEQWRALQGGDATSYPWVAAVRQLQRPAFAAVVIGAWCLQVAVQGEPSPTVANMAQAVGFYLFGDRTLFYVKGKA